MGIVNPPVLSFREIRVLAELHGGPVHGVVGVEIDQIVIDTVLAGGLSGFYHTESDPCHVPALFLELLGAEILIPFRGKRRVNKILVIMQCVRRVAGAHQGFGSFRPAAILQSLGAAFAEFLAAAAGAGVLGSQSEFFVFSIHEKTSKVCTSPSPAGGNEKIRRKFRQNRCRKTEQPPPRQPSFCQQGHEENRGARVRD